ncbi:MAG: deoxyribose-phosphate aldolase [Balneolales bacterium]
MQDRFLRKIPDFDQTIPVDQVGVDDRVARFRTRSIKMESKIFALKLALQMVDLTTLEGMDTPAKVRQLCYKALYPCKTDSDIPRVAAVCVYPNRVRLCKDILKNTGIKIASVATSFPGGMNTLESRIEEVRYAVNEGADEIDMVISRWAFLKGDYKYVFDEIAVFKNACKPARLKVILETGELETYENVRKASDISMYAGADFIKTSTGKITPAATMSVTLVMLEAIRDYYFHTGRKVGMKPAGGIRNAKTALHYLVMLKETLGAEWLTPELFRFGASSLVNDLLMQIIKEKTGSYQSSDYFSIG